MKEILLNIDWNPVLSGLIAVISGLLTYFLNKLKKIYDEKVTNDTIRAVVDDVVGYVERTMTNEDNKDKYAKALELASDWLESKGISISGVELGLIIEGAVNKLPRTEKGE